MIFICGCWIFGSDFVSGILLLSVFLLSSCVKMVMRLDSLARMSDLMKVRINGGCRILVPGG
jgi:hypothetical protein